MIKRLLLAGYCFLSIMSGLWAQNVGDFRSKASGNWNSEATWEVYSGSSWVSPDFDRFYSDMNPIGWTNQSSFYSEGSNQGLYYMQSSGNPGLNWYYTQVSLVAGRTYSIKYDFRTSTTTTSNHSHRIAIGNQIPNASNWGTALFNASAAPGTTWTSRTGTTTFTPQVSGDYYLGFYLISASSTWSQLGRQVILDSDLYPLSNKAITVDIRTPHFVTQNMAHTTSSNTIFVNDGATLSFGPSNGNFNFASLTVYSGGTFIRNNSTYTHSGTVYMESGAIYRHNVNGGTIRSMTWEPGSTLEVTGVTSSVPTTEGALQNVIWNCPGQTSSLALSSNFNTILGNFSVESTGTTLLSFTGSSSIPVFSIGGDLIINGGNLCIGTTANVSLTINLEGGVIVNGGSFSAYNGSNDSLTGIIGISFSNSLNANKSSILQMNTEFSDPRHAKWNLNISSGRTIRFASDFVIGSRYPTNNDSYQTFTVEDGATLDIGSYVLREHAGITNAGAKPRFILSSGATLITANANGIASSGTTGSIQVSGSRTYNTAANYTYNGSVTQVTGNGLPATVNRLTIDNPAGLTLTNPLTINADLLLQNGVFDLNANALTVNGITNVTNGYFAEGSNPSIDGFNSSSLYLNIAADNQNISAFSASTSLNNENYPSRIKRQWIISGDQNNPKTITFSWTAEDDNNFNWTGKIPSIFRGSTEYSADALGNSFEIVEGIRKLIIVAPISSSKEIWKVGLKGGDQTLPVELSSFTAMISAHGFVQLMWITQSETNVRGFYVYRSQAPDLQMAELVSPLIAATNTSTSQSYVYLDRDIYSNGDYYYWLQNVDMDGSESFHGPILLSYNIGGAGDIPTPPLATMLSSIYPNPFFPDANISFSLAKASDVKINIYNQRGQIVRSMELGAKTMGHHSLRWNGVDANGNVCGNGLYIFDLLVDGQSYRKKASLMK